MEAGRVMSWKGLAVRVEAMSIPVGDTDANALVKVMVNNRIGHEPDDCYGEEFIVDQKELEPIAQQELPVGTHVKSKVGSLVGIVVGHELDTNRVIVKSERIDNYPDRRTRYAYKLNELTQYDPDAFEFVIGAKYRVTGGHILRAIEHPVLGETVLLINNRDGKVAKVMPISTTISAINKAGITSIKRI